MAFFSFVLLRVLLYSYSFFFNFVGLSLDFVYIVNVSWKTLKKVNFFNTKWQVVGRPDFPLCQSNLTGFSGITLAQFTRSLSFGHFLKDFFLLHQLVIKDIFSHEVHVDVTNGRRAVVPSWAVFRCQWVKCKNRKLHCNSWYGTSTELHFRNKSLFLLLFYLNMLPF